MAKAVTGKIRAISGTPVFEALLLSCAALAAAAQAQQAAENNTAECGSAVIIKCEPPPAANIERAQRSRDVEARRQNAGVQQLDGIVIEADTLRRRSIEEIIGSAFPPLRPRDGTHSFASNDGSRCTCMNVCPPFPLPCCNCSPMMSRYLSTPGSSPLN